MRHGYFGNQLSRNKKGAQALYRSLLTELFDHGKIETTIAKAKAIVPTIDKVVNFAKKNTVSARREVTKIFGSEKILNKIFNDVAPRFTNRNSGYSRIIRLGERYSDSAKMAILELVEGVEPVKIETKDTSSEIQEKKIEKRSKEKRTVKPKSVQKAAKSKK